MNAFTAGRLPHVRFAITRKCNLSCAFCGPYGENGVRRRADLTCSENERVLAALASRGFEHLKVTGGEPLLSESWTRLVVAARQSGFRITELVTNGQLLTEQVSMRHRALLDAVYVSLPAVDPATYRSITGGGDVMKALAGVELLARLGIPTVVHFIAMQCNIAELGAVLEVCSANRCGLKVLELLEHQVSPQFYETQYVAAGAVITRIRRACKSCVTREVSAVGGIGKRLVEIATQDGIRIWVFGRGIGGEPRFGRRCQECSAYPCQDGLYGLRLTCDGRLLRCWGGDAVGIDLWSHLRDGRPGSAEEAIAVTLSEFDSSLSRVTGCRLAHSQARTWL